MFNFFPVFCFEIAVLSFLRVFLWLPGVCSGLPSFLRVSCFSSFSDSVLVVPSLISENADTLSF